MMKELVFCKECIHAKPKQGIDLDYCSKHRRYVTKHTVANSYRDDRECKDFIRKGAAHD